MIWKEKLKGFFNMTKRKRKKNKKKNRKKILDMGRSNMTIKFVDCINPACVARWNPAVKDKCPVCNSGANPTTESKTENKVVIKRTSPFIDEPWETEIDCVEECSKAPESITIWIKPMVKEKIDFLMKEFKSIEWLAYLVGENFIVEDLLIPKQNVTATRVDNIDCPEYNDSSVIGVMHSHHGMGTGFSGVDHEWINGNHDISIVIANTGAAGQVRYKTPCGSIKIVNAVVKLKLDTGIDLVGFKEDIDKKIKKSTYTYNSYLHSHNRGTKVLTPAQKSYCAGAAISDRTMKKDTWNTEDVNPENDDPKELNFEEDKTLAEELDAIEHSGMF